jgi:hypothetical protein
MGVGRETGGYVGALPRTPQGNDVPLTLSTLSLRDSWEGIFLFAALSWREAEKIF